MKINGVDYHSLGEVEYKMGELKLQMQNLQTEAIIITKHLQDLQRGKNDMNGHNYQNSICSQENFY